jgi:hypothetical protein
MANCKIHLKSPNPFTGDEVINCRFCKLGFSVLLGTDGIKTCVATPSTLEGCAELDYTTPESARKCKACDWFHDYTTINVEVVDKKKYYTCRKVQMGSTLMAINYLAALIVGFFLDL